MSIAHKRRWIIEDLRDRYSVAGIAKRRGVSESMVHAIWAEWSAERKRVADRCSKRRQRLKRQQDSRGGNNKRIA